MSVAERSASRRLDWLVGGVLLVVQAAILLVLLPGPRAVDPARYFDTAVEFPDVPIDLWTLRIGLIAPVRLAVLAFGPSEAAYYAVPIAAGLLLCAAVYGTMLVLFGDRVVAAAAALATVLNTDYLFNSGYIYPDTTATATFVAGYFFLVLAAARSERGESRHLPTVAVVVAGVLFGWTYLVREFSPILLLPAVAAAVVLLRHPVRRTALLAGVAILTGALELVYGWVRFGEPFVHLQELIARNHSSFSAPRAAKIEHIQGQLDTVFDTMVVFPRLLLAWRSGWLVLLALAVFAAALVVVRDRRLWLFAIWFLGYWAIMTVIGLPELRSGRWILNIANVRYWTPVLPALAMGTFAGVWLLVQRWLPGRRGASLAQLLAVTLAVVVLVPGLAEFRSCSQSQGWWNDPSERWHDLRAWLLMPAAKRYDVIWTDVQTERLVSAYTATTFGRHGWSGDVRTFVLDRPIEPTTALERTLILVHVPRVSRLSRSAEARLTELRSDWSPVFASADGAMVLLAHEPAVALTAAQARRWWDLTDALPPRGEPGVCGRSPYEAPDTQQ